MKKILVSLAMVSLLAAPLVGLAQPITPTEPDCTVEHNLKDYAVCCAYTPGGALVCLGNLEDAEPSENTKDWKITYGIDYTQCCLIDKILTVGDYIFIAILVVAILVILIAAWTFLTAAGNPDKVTKARNYLIYGLIGVAVAFLAKVLVKVIAAIMA